MLVALAIRVRGGQEVEKLARGGPVGAVPGGAQGGVSEASSGLALDPLLVLSSVPSVATLRVFPGGAGGGLCPLRPPTANVAS